VLKFLWLVVAVVVVATTLEVEAVAVSYIIQILE
jgi:hypothetical protein